MTNADIATKCATQDMNRAKRHGALLIGRTKEGTVSLSYAGGVYELAAAGTVLAPRILASGAPRDVRPVLASLYVIEHVEG